MTMPDRRSLLFAALAATLAAAAWVTVREQSQAPAKRPTAEAARGELTARRGPAQNSAGDLLLPPRAAQSGEIVDLFALRADPSSGGGPRQEKPAAPPLPFVFLGRYAEGDVMKVFLGDGEQLYMVKAGDVIEQKYRVDKIDSVVRMTYLPLNETQILAIGDM